MDPAPLTLASPTSVEIIVVDPLPWARTNPELESTVATVLSEERQVQRGCTVPPSPTHGPPFTDSVMVSPT